MSLKEYKAKRKFTATPEPEGKEKKTKGSLKFVIQKHAASHLHYDFRLEMEGVLKSWAVPKGPSVNPTDKRLAMMVEDHPIEYGKFEGIIPKGNYGGGTVMVWDEGTYHGMDAEGEEITEKELLKDLHGGNIKFVLDGRKLKGEFTLVKIQRSEKGNEWLLIKKKDKYLDTADITMQDKSILTERSLEEIAKQSGKGKTVWHSKPPEQEVDLSSATKAKMPHSIKPMLATLVKDSFDSEDWLFEIKWDGYRALGEVNYNDVKIYSRNDLPFNKQFPTIAEALQVLSIQAVLDGEIVALDENGMSQFQLIQNYKRTGNGNIVYYVFDILYYNGFDLTSLTLLERKAILKKILPASNNIRYNDHIIGKGKKFFEQAAKQKLEGIIGKKITSEYVLGSRSKNWVKIKTERRQEAVIAGFTEPRGGRKNLGSLVLGVYEKDELIYIGHTGGGFNDKSLQEMYKKLKPLVIEQSPFKKVPKTNMPVQWVKPELVCEIKFQEWTEEGSMRIPIFVEIREDKNPKEVKREMEKETKKVVDQKALSDTEKKSIKKEKISITKKPVLKKTVVQEKAAKKSTVAKPSAKKKVADDNLNLSARPDDLMVSVDGQSLKLTNLNKIYWEEEGYTKGDLLQYYDKIAPFILPYLKDRPESLRRNPNGYKEASFFQKDMPDTTPAWIETMEIYSESNDANINYMFCQNKASLLYMANLGCIEINPWSSRKGSLENPDYIVIDLDPKDVPYQYVIETAQAVKEVLDRAKIAAYPKTSGSKGIHIYIPMGAKYDYDQAKQFAHLLATLTNELVPKITSLERMPDKRKNKVYIDFLQNRTGQTLAAPYCVRPKPGATVSTPLSWEEIKSGFDPSIYTIKTIFDRLEKVGDIFTPVMGKGIDLVSTLKKLKT